MRAHRGFTIIELMVVMAIVALLASVVAPRYFRHIDKARESVLHQNLFVVRDAIDKYYADTGKYPASLQALVDAKYLRALPEDPLTGRTDTWRIVAPANKELGNLYDLHSAAPGMASNGTAYASW